MSIYIKRIKISIISFINNNKQLRIYLLSNNKTQKNNINKYKFNRNKINLNNKQNNNKITE